MRNLEEIEKRCVEELSTDFVPLNDLVREFSGYEKILPSENEFSEAILYLEFLIKKYKLICYEGPGGRIINKPTEELIKFLTKKWQLDQYEQINYSIWFEMPCP